MEHNADAGLAALEARVRQDLDYLCRPPANWVVPKEADGEPIHDVVIIGGGMCGMLVWFALQSAGMRNVRIVDGNPAGLEGPWETYARMETLRSPKHLTGPAYSMGSLTFRAWFEAQYSVAAWEELDKIPRPMWMDYLRWYRKILSVPIENNVEVRQVRPEVDFLHLELGGEGARQSDLRTRKLIMATGREGTGRPNIPTFMDGVPRRYFAHSSDDIDFSALRGKRVAVIGVGASAVENAAEAAEAGASEVRLLARRKKMPTINKMMGIGSFGFSAGYAALSDEWRWRFMQYSFATQTPAPHGSTRPCQPPGCRELSFGCSGDRRDAGERRAPRRYRRRPSPDDRFSDTGHRLHDRPDGENRIRRDGSRDPALGRCSCPARG